MLNHTENIMLHDTVPPSELTKSERDIIVSYILRVSLVISALIAFVCPPRHIVSYILRVSPVISALIALFVCSIVPAVQVYNHHTEQQSTTIGNILKDPWLKFVGPVFFAIITLSIDTRHSSMSEDILKWYIKLGIFSIICSIPFALIYNKSYNWALIYWEVVVVIIAPIICRGIIYVFCVGILILLINRGYCYC